MGQISLFDYENEDVPNDLRKNNIRKVKYLKTEQFDCDELFSGYKRLRAITFSYDLRFINKIAKKFKKVEIIFGCDALVNYDLNVIMANQKATIENIKKYKDLTKRVQNGEIQFYVSEKISSHTKLYILDNLNEPDTKEFEDVEINQENLDKKSKVTRVITGSSNFSNRGMNGYQLEDNVYFDNDMNAYLDYEEEYENFKSTCVNNLIKKSLLTSEKEIQINDLPSVQNAIKTNTSIIVEEALNPDEAEYKIITNNYAGTLEDFKFEREFCLISMGNLTKMKFSKIIKGMMKLEKESTMGFIEDIFQKWFHLLMKLCISWKKTVNMLISLLYHQGL